MDHKSNHHAANHIAHEYKSDVARLTAKIKRLNIAIEQYERAIALYKKVISDHGMSVDQHDMTRARANHELLIARLEGESQ